MCGDGDGSEGVCINCMVLYMLSVVGVLLRLKMGLCLTPLAQPTQPPVLPLSTNTHTTQAKSSTVCVCVFMWVCLVAYSWMGIPAIARVYCMWKQCEVAHVIEIGWNYDLANIHKFVLRTKITTWQYKLVWWWHLVLLLSQQTKNYVAVTAELHQNSGGKSTLIFFFFF